MSAASTRVAPRGATPETFSPAIVPPPSSKVQVDPPLVVRHTPTRSFPRRAELLNRPAPAINVWLEASVGSNPIYDASL